MIVNRRTAVLVLGLAPLSAGRLYASQTASWPDILARARGQEVYWAAWAGDPAVNRFIDWTATQVRERFGTVLHQVKLADTSDAVTLLLAEKAAARKSGGRMDLLWLNGENFALLKAQGLLFGPFTDALPNFALVDTIHKPTTVNDFTIPTEGFEAPWGMAQIVFFADGRVPEPPRSLSALKAWAGAHEGRFTYPAPPDFTGTTFIKQVLVDLTSAPDRAALYIPADDAVFTRLMAPVWTYLDAIHPFLWRNGKSFPANYAALKQLMADGEIDIAFAFNPAEAASAVAQGVLPATTHAFTFIGGTIGNTHFVAIPADAAAKDGAMVVANFLLSPEAQARKADAAVWGDPTVLDLAKLTPDQRGLFAKVGSSPAMPTPDDLAPVLPEPHPSWTPRIVQAWQKRYRR